MVVDLGRGGLGLVTGVTLHEADSVRVRLEPVKGATRIEVSGIVWSERVVESSGQRGKRRLVLGIMLSDPPPDYLNLLARRGLPEDEPAPRRRKPGLGADFADAAIRRQDRIARSSVEVVREAKTDPSLPRSKQPLPPPKPTPEEQLPQFSARAKLRGAARTRRIVVTAVSLREAEDRIMEELGADWEILELTSQRRH